MIVSNSGIQQAHTHLVHVDEAGVAGAVAQPGVAPRPLRVVVHDALQAEGELDDVGGDLGRGVEVGERLAVVHHHHDLKGAKACVKIQIHKFMLGVLY